MGFDGLSCVRVNNPIQFMKTKLEGSRPLGSTITQVIFVRSNFFSPPFPVTPPRGKSMPPFLLFATCKISRYPRHITEYGWMLSRQTIVMTLYPNKTDVLFLLFGMALSAPPFPDISVDAPAVGGLSTR